MPRRKPEKHISSRRIYFRACPEKQGRASSLYLQTSLLLLLPAVRCKLQPTCFLKIRIIARARPEMMSRIIYALARNRTRQIHTYVRTYTYQTACSFLCCAFQRHIKVLLRAVVVVVSQSDVLTARCFSFCVAAAAMAPIFVLVAR